MNVFSNAFSENPAKVEIPATDDKPEVEVETPDVPDPAGSSPAQEEKPEAEKPKDEPSKQGEVETVPHAALHAARLKAKEAEERARAAEARLAEQEKKPKTSVMEDEDKAFQERLSEAIAPVRMDYFNLTVELAREKPGREDYDEIYAFMEDEVKKDPSLMQQILSAPRPGEHIYQLGKARKDLAEVGGDITKLREQIAVKERQKLSEAQERIKALEAELSSVKGSKEKREAIPSSLNAEQSGAVKGDTFAGPTPLKSVFNN